MLPLLLLLWGACAKEGFPPGGPEDRIAPRVVLTTPLSGSTKQVDLDEISIEFSERVVRRSAEEAIYVIPTPARQLRFRWSGTTLYIQIPQRAKEVGTYIVTVGAAVRDFRGNYMQNSHTFAFSTGDFLDTKMIRGVVRDDTGKSVAAVVWALNPDSCDGLIAMSPPQYVTQSGDDGTFVFNYLAKGTYRLVAFIDKNRDGFPSFERELIGGTDRDIVAGKEREHGRDAELVVVAIDTVGPTPLRAFIRQGRILEVVFDMPVATSTDPVGYLEVTDTLGGSSIAPDEIIPSRSDAHTIVGLLHVATDTFATQVHIARFSAINGPTMKDTIALDIAFVNTDTLKPFIATTLPRNNAQHVLPDAFWTGTFTTLMDTDTPPYIQLQDSMGGVIPSVTHWSSRITAQVTPTSLLMSSMRYTVAVSLATCRSFNGYVGEDSLYTVTFTSINTDTLGEFSGRVVGCPVEDMHNVYVLAKKTGESLQGAGIILKTTVDTEGVFQFTQLLPGSYVLEAFVDHNNDGMHSPTMVRPFSFMEPRAVSDIPINVRPLWEVVGVVLTFPAGINEIALPLGEE